MTELVMQEESVIERLEKTFVQALNLLDHQTQDRQLLVKDKEELGKLTQLLINQTKEIGKYEAGIRKRIQDCIKESANAAMKNIEESVTVKNSETIEQVINKIDQIGKSVESTLQRFQAGKAGHPWKIIAVAIVSGILSGLAAVWFLMPKPTLPLTSEQINYLQEGQMLVKIWPKLTLQEKDRLKSVSYEISRSKQVS